MEAIIESMTWPFFPYFMASLLGACLGSFANVLIFRLPRNLSILWPRSFCPSCQQQVRWYDNVPLLSWLILRGRCRYCSTVIGGQYLLTELLGAICGVIAVWRFGPTWIGLTAFLFLINLLVIARIDWEHMIIPHTLTVTGIILGLALAPLNGLGIVQSLLGGVSGASIVLILAYGYKMIRGQIGMGGGDVMLMGMVGTFLGVLGVGLVLFGGALLGSLYVLIRYRHGLRSQSKLPFGTFLASAAALAFFAGEIVVSWYLSLLV